MFELGDYAKQLHEKVGKAVVDSKIDILICTGDNAKYIVQEAKRQGMNENNIFYFESKEDIIENISKMWKKGDIILLKASNGMRFFDIVDKLKY